MALDLEIVYTGNNDMIIEVDGLQDPTDSSYQNGATVTATVYDRSGTEVSGVSWPLTLSYVAASNGKYRGTIDKAAAFSIGVQYKAVVTASSGTLDGEFVRYAIAEERLS